MHNEPKVVTAKEKAASRVMAEMRTASTDGRKYSNSPCKSAGKPEDEEVDSKY
jgi:hypothetical protein